LETSPRLLYQLIAEEADRNPHAPAILSPGRQALSFKGLAGHMQNTTLQMARWGFRPGDRVAVVLPNGPEMAAAFLAVSAVCTCAPLNPAYPMEEFLFSMKDLGVKALVTGAMDSPACKAAEGLGIPVIKLEPDGRVGGMFQLVSDLPVDEILSTPMLAGVEDVALVLHTSGTTARPKIVPLTHQNIYYSTRNIVGSYALTRADRCLNMMPLFHIHGLIGALAASLVCGASVICAPGFVPDQVLAWMEDLAPTWYTAVPTMHQSILDQVRRQPGAANRVHLRFIRSCSSALAPQVARDLESVFSTPVLEAYGMTEATHQIASNPLPPRAHKYGSVGLATGTTRVSILDEHGGALPPNTVGEICIRGENVMAGYENNPSANAASFVSGWLRTGDRGTLDEDGYVFIQGRLKELINRGGEKISPREIDEVLLRHPAVRQAVAFAIPHPTLGEDVAAAVVLYEGQAVTMQELRQFAAAGLADFKVPRLIVFIPEIPKGATGKVQRIGLSEKLKTELEALRSREPVDHSAPPTRLEQEILSIWQDMLGLENLGIHDDFLVLGGESIQAARILTRVNERFHTNLQVKDIFTASTVALIAKIVQEHDVQDTRHE
jgi:acyl-CoA synthetase (AMP-forming)/AMP-acid ligase II/acyl carrier protein